MKWLFVLLLALAIFGGAAWFGYNTFVKEEIEVKKEQRGEVTPPPAPDISLAEFQAAAQLRQDGKLQPKQSAKVTAKVAETMAWKGGKRVGIGNKEYLSSTRWIRLAGAPAYTIYSVSDAAHPTLEQPPPPTGFGLAASDVEELSSLVNNKTAVTIID